MWAERHLTVPTTTTFTSLTIVKETYFEKDMQFCRINEATQVYTYCTQILHNHDGVIIECRDIFSTVADKYGVSPITNKKQVTWPEVLELVNVHEMKTKQVGLGLCM